MNSHPFKRQQSGLQTKISKTGASLMSDSIRETAASPSSDAWAVNEDAMKNLGCMQLKKTHDAAILLIERNYGEKPRFNCFFGSSQGGREALAVAQRYPADYGGIAAMGNFIRRIPSNVELMPSDIFQPERCRLRLIVEAKEKGDPKEEATKAAGFREAVKKSA
jgi:hypothetical protein